MWLFSCLALFVAVSTWMALRMTGVATTQTERVLDCPYVGIAAHTHNTDCFDSDGNLVCPLPERESHTHDESCYDEGGNLICGMEETLEEHQHGPGCFIEVSVEDEDDSLDGDTIEQTDVFETAEVYEVESDEQNVDSSDLMPAQSFSHEFTAMDGTHVLTVDVDAPEGALPEGTSMHVTWIDPDDFGSVEQDAVEEALAEKTNGKLTELQVVDIAFVDEHEQEIRPSKKVTVTLTSDLLDTDEQLHLVHLNKPMTTQEQVQNEDGLESDRTARVLDVLTEEELDEREMTLGNDQVAFEKKYLSTSVLAVTTLEKTLEFSDGNSYAVTVDAPASAGVRQDAQLEVHEIVQDEESKAYETYVAQAERALGWEAGTSGYVRMLDISILDVAGNKVQPAEGSKVEVSIHLDDAQSDALSVVHFADGEETPDVVSDADVTADNESGQVVEFQADGFSVYVIINHEGEEEVVTPRVEFHFIAEDFAESGTSYVASPYNFVNTSGDYQTTQILKDGESLELITNPPNITVENGDGTTSEKFFYGWYVVDASDDTSSLNPANGRYTGDVTYTWPADAQDKIKFRDAMSLEALGSAEVGDTVTWAIGDVTGTGVLDEEGTARLPCPAVRGLLLCQFPHGSQGGHYWAVQQPADPQTSCVWQWRHR